MFYIFEEPLCKTKTKTKNRTSMSLSRAFVINNVDDKGRKDLSISVDSWNVQSP